MPRKKSLLGRVVTLIGLSFFTVELVLLAVFTLFHWSRLRELERERVDRHATLVRERVRAALLGLDGDERDLDLTLDRAVESGRGGGRPAPAAPARVEDEQVDVWVFTPAGGARRFSAAGQLLGEEESGWEGEVPPAVRALLAADALAGPVVERPELIVRVEPIASGRDGPPAGVLYLSRSLAEQQRQVALFAGAAFAAGAMAVLVTAVVTMLYLRRSLLLPLSRLIRADAFARRGQEDKALVDPGDIPDDEIGAIMLSRNELYTAMRGAQRDLDEKNAELAAQREELRVWGRELERLVEEKTRALLRARDRLHRDEKLVALGRLAANVAHEINNPLASIAGWAEAGREELNGLPGPAAAEVGAALTTIEEQAFRCKEILKRLLGLARAGDLPRVELDLAQVVEEALQLVLPGADKRQVEVRDRVGGPGPQIVSEPGAIEQIVANLVENAIDAAAAGTTRPAWVEVRLEAGELAAAIVVTDSGQGIAPEVLPRVFDPFYTTKPVGRGTGLGLAISQSLVERLGGSISVENGPDGAGAVFRVELPRRADTSGRLPRQSPASQAALRPGPERPAAAQSQPVVRAEPPAAAPPGAAPPPGKPDASGWLESHLRHAGAGADPDA